MFIHQISWFLLLFFVVLSTTSIINTENDSNDDIELTADM